MAARSSAAALFKRALATGASQQQQVRCMSSEGPRRKVAVLGAAGGIGQPLGLLMKLNPLVTDLSLYDIAATPGVACDISHINTGANVRARALDLPILYIYIFCLPF
jgi:malate dehydrogenase